MFRNRLPILFLAVIALTLSLQGCCPPNCPPHPPPPPQLKFKEMWADPVQALSGRTINFHWDYEEPGLLKSQWYEVMALTMKGEIFRVVVGRPVMSNGEFDPQFQNNPALPLTQRDGSFEFVGAVTLVIFAESTDGKILKAAVDITLENAFLRVTIAPAQDLETNDFNLTFPRVFQGAKPETLDFPVFFATYDQPPTRDDAPNGLIDFFERLGVPVGEGNNPFFGRSYRDDPNNSFGFAQGIIFPRLETDYLNLSPDAIDLSQNRRFIDLGGRYLAADAILLGGRIIYHGEELVTKGPNGNVISRTGDFAMEPIFFEVDFRSENGGNLHVVDMHLGNVPQGFVASAFWGPTAGRALNATPLPASSYDFSQASGEHPTGIFTGTLGASAVPLATLGFNANGYPRYIHVTDARWQNVPFFSDFDLSGVPVVIERSP